MKRSIALLLAAVLLISLPGCAAVPEQPVQTLPNTLSTQAPTEPPAAEIPPITITEVMPDNEKLCLGHKNQDLILSRSP